MPSPIHCPRCKTPTLKKPYETVEIDFCPTCKGTWLDQGELEEVIAVEQETFTPDFVVKTLNQAVAGIPDSETTAALACPVCRKNTRCINYNYGSGVIINICSEHGIWFDAGELERIEVFMEYWKSQKKAHGAEWLKKSADAAAAERSRISEVDQKIESMSLIFKLMSYLGK